MCIYVVEACPISALPYTSKSSCSQKRRVRKEVTTLTDTERRLYIDAVVELSTNPKYETRYRTLLDTHKKAARRRQFLDYSRWLLMEYENLLCEINPKVTLPYWDSSCWACNPLAAPLWNDDFMGGDGDPEQDYCVTNGPFAKDKWSLPCDQCLKRQIQCPFPPAEVINQAMSCNDADCLNTYLKTVYHFQLHGHNGGTLTSQATAYAPEYFLYHTDVDKLWDDWQQSRPSILHIPGDVDELVPQSMYSVREFLDTRNLPGGISVTYEPYVCSGAPEICRCTSCYSNKETPFTSMFEPMLFFNVSESNMRALYESTVALNRAQ